MQKICTLCDDTCEECNEIRTMSQDNVVQQLLSYKFQKLDVDDFMFEHKNFVLMLFHFISFNNFHQHEHFKRIFNKIITLACIVQDCTWVYMVFHDLYANFTTSDPIQKILCSHVKTKLLTTSKTDESMLLCDCFMLYLNSWDIATVDDLCITTVIFHKLLHDPDDSYFFDFCIEKYYKQMTSNNFIRYLEMSSNESSKVLLKKLVSKSKNTLSLYDYVISLYTNY